MIENYDVCAFQLDNDYQNHQIDVEIKYWSLRIIALALEEIAYSDPPHPKVSASVVEDLRNLLLQLDLDLAGKNLISQSDAGVNLEGERGQGEPGVQSSKTDSKVRKPLDLAPADQTVIKALITISVNNLAKTVLKIWNISNPSGNLNNTDTNPDKPTESDLSRAFSNILVNLKEMKAEEVVIDREIDECEVLRMQEMEKYEKLLDEVKELLTELMGETLLKKKSEVMSNYIDHLKMQSDLLTTRTRLAKLQQLREENPPELVNEMEEVYKKLLTAKADKEKECDVLKDTLAKYESLGPKFKEIASEYQILEEEIKTKEWVLQELSTVPADQSLSDSFFN